MKTKPVLSARSIAIALITIAGALVASVTLLLTAPAGSPPGTPGAPAGAAGAAGAANPEIELAGPFTHKNLELYLVIGEDQLEDVAIVTLDEALEKKIAVVHETGDVGSLRIENTSSDAYVYVHPGEIVKGGRQDRTLPNGFLLSPRSKPVPIDSFCVESGRWAKRGGESDAAFSRSSKALSSKKLKLAARHRKDQGEVWKNVAETQDKISEKIAKDVKAQASTTSLQLALEDKDLAAAVAAYKKSINGQAAADLDGAIGFAFAINGAFNSADLFASKQLFHKLWPKLLDATATEAVAESDDAKSFAAVGPDAILASLKVPPAAPATETILAAKNSVVSRESATNVYLDTVGEAGEKKTRVHRSVISKDPAPAAPTAAPPAQENQPAVLKQLRSDNSSPTPSFREPSPTRTPRNLDRSREK